MPSCSSFRRCGVHSQGRQPVTYPARQPTSKVPVPNIGPGGTNPPCPPCPETGVGVLNQVIRIMPQMSFIRFFGTAEVFVGDQTTKYRKAPLMSASFTTEVG